MNEAPAPVSLTDRMQVREHVALRDIVSEMIEQHARQQATVRSFLDDLDKFDRVAKTVANTVALPQWIRGDSVKDGDSTAFRPRPVVEQEKIALSVILAGAELGLSPMVSIRHVFLVEGKVGLSAEIMLALIIRAGVRYRWTEKTAEKATLWLHRAGQDPHEQSFTIEEARRAGLVGGDGQKGKFNWRAYPAAMLRARAISAAARAYCPDVTNGCYTREEMEDFAEERAEAAAAPRPPATVEEILQRKTAPEPAPDDGPLCPKIVAAMKAAKTPDELAELVKLARDAGDDLDAAEREAIQRTWIAANERIRKGE